ncbi:cation:dicarboxylate symporter family transporter [Bifidobacterium catenulatum]|nr:cation:dicarboxylase symporter family transporter [Bifidobacterium catenulatum]
MASFVAGLGANLGMPGCAGVWPMLLAVFAVHAQGLNYSPAQYLFLVVLTLLVSIGTVGVPGTATITATSLFAAAGLPIPFIAISQPISQIVDMGRTALNVAGAANTAVIVAQTEHQLDTDLYYGRKEYSDDLNDGEQFRQTSTQALTGTGPSQRTNITNDAKFDSANVSQQQSGFTLNFAPNAVLSASGDDACCGTKPNK